MNIHLIEHSNNFKMLEDETWESGWWELNETNAQKLVGGEIYFHKKRQEPSFYGGTILGYRVEQGGGQYQGRIIFRLQYSQSCRNVRTDKTGWSKEMKIIPKES
jgi:hypothetical protein